MMWPRSLESSSLRVATLAVGPPNTPSVRFRVNQLLPVLERQGIRTNVLYPNWRQAKFRPLARFAYLCRVFREAWGSDVVWVQKVTLPTIVIRLLKRVNTHILYDFDDAIYTTHSFHKAGTSTRIWGRESGQLVSVLRASCVVAVGNPALGSFARRFCSDVVEIPTSVDVEAYSPHPTASLDESFVVGWIGSAENLRYLELVSDALALFCRCHPGTIVRVVSNSEYHAEGLSIENVPWSEDREIAELRSFSVGLMPSPDDDWARGKCAFKAIQYMAVGIPVIASPVGMATVVVQDGVTGILAKTQADWVTALEELHQDPQWRRSLGLAGRRKAVAEFSSLMAGQRMGDALRMAAGLGGSMIARTARTASGHSENRGSSSSRKPTRGKP